MNFRRPSSLRLRTGNPHCHLHTFGYCVYPSLITILRWPNYVYALWITILCWPNYVYASLITIFCWPNYVYPSLITILCWPNCVYPSLITILRWPNYVYALLITILCWPNYVYASLITIFCWPNYVYPFPSCYACVGVTYLGAIYRLLRCRATPSALQLHLAGHAMSDHGSHESRPVDKVRGMATRSSRSTERRLAEIFQQKYDGWRTVARDARKALRLVDSSTTASRLVIGVARRTCGVHPGT